MMDSMMDTSSSMEQHPEQPGSTFPVITEITMATEVEMDSIERIEENRMLRDAEFYAEAFVQNGILFCGIIFNAINFAILRRLSMGENYRVCLLALTISDFCACVFGVIQLTIEGVFFRSILPFGKWDIIAFMDYCLYFTYLMFMCTSGFFVIFIAIVRTYTLRKPMTAMSVFTIKRVRRACVWIFIVTFLLFLPTSIWGVWQTCYDDKKHPRCEAFFEHFPHVHNLKYYFYLLSLIFGPVVITLNIICLIALKRSLKRGRTTASAVRRPTSIYKMVQRHSKITRTLAFILVLDTIWVLPTCVQYAFGFILKPEDTIFKRDVALKIFDLVAEILLNIRPTYNIFVFLATNKYFRRKFCQIFFRRCGYVAESSSSGGGGGYVRSDEANMNNRRKMSSQAIMGYQVHNTESTSATNVAHKTPPHTPDPQTPDPFLTPQPPSRDGNNGTKTEGSKNNNAKVRKQISWRPTENLEQHYETVNGGEEKEDTSVAQSDMVTYADNALFQRESIGVE